ncbi:MAG: hypothetical protein HY911_11950 [Desulfobacterales bacterium]|nr:hypothetical protein [Desulfobacterales bacterium]
MPHRFRRIALIVLLIAFAALAASGVLDRGLGWCGLDRLARANDGYLDRAFDRALAGFLLLSGIKSGLAIVEGSSVGVGVQVELGDAVQPAYDYVDTAWKAAMAGASIIALMKLVLQGLTLIDHWVLFAALVLWLAYFPALWWFPRGAALQKILGRAGRFTVTLCAMLYLLLPLTIAGAALLSQRITAPLVESSHDQLKTLGQALAPERIQEKFFPQESETSSSLFDLKEKIAQMGQGVKALMAYLKLESERMAALTIRLMAAYLFDCILFPLVFGLILMTMIKSGVQTVFALDRGGSI